MYNETIGIVGGFGADYIILVCGTAHTFLDDCYKLISDAKGKVLNIIDLARQYLKSVNITNALSIAAEGCLKSGVYHSNFALDNLQCTCLSEDDYSEIRYFIESVKQNTLGKIPTAL